MRIKFLDSDNEICVVDCIWFGIYNDDKIGIETADDSSCAKSNKPLASIDKLDYERWSDELFRTGMLDLTNTSYRFTFNIDDEEDSEDTE